MKHSIPFLLLYTIIIASCGTEAETKPDSNCYNGYTITYQGDGIIVLQNKDSVKLAVDSITNKTNYKSTNSKDYDPEFGKEIDNKLALEMIQRYQAALDAKNDKTTPRFLDFHYPHTQLFINNIGLGDGKPADYALRLYYAINAEGKITVVMAPVMKKGTNQVSAIWHPEANAGYKTFNFGSNCPERCPNGSEFETGLNIYP